MINGAGERDEVRRCVSDLGFVANGGVLGMDACLGFGGEVWGRACRAEGGGLEILRGWCREVGRCCAFGNRNSHSHFQFGVNFLEIRCGVVMRGCVRRIWAYCVDAKHAIR